MSIGWQHGAPLTRQHPRTMAPEDARTIEDCIAVATEHGGRHGIALGWQTCLEQVLPEPPTFTWRGRELDECVGLTCTEDGVAYLMIVDGAPHEIPLAQIPMPPLTSTATLWLSAYDAWRVKK